MSQYLSFYLIKKDTSEKVSLGYFCTTPARTIADIGAFPYTEEEVVLDEHILSDYLRIIRDEVSKSERYLADNLNRRANLEQNIFKCSSKEVAQMFMEQLDDLDRSIIYCKEDLEDWNYRESKISIIFDIWKDNKDKWDLCYNNC